MYCIDFKISKYSNSIGATKTLEEVRFLFALKNRFQDNFPLLVVLYGYLKVPKCENFHRTDFFYFFAINPLRVGDFRAKIKN